VVAAMNALEQLTYDVRAFAIEVRQLGYWVPGGHENQFLELSERMIRRADDEDRSSHTEPEVNRNLGEGHA
jgi:hypothetical protein